MDYMMWGYLFSIVIVLPFTFLQGMEQSSGDVSSLSQLFTNSRYGNLRKEILKQRLDDATQESKFEIDEHTLKLVSKTFYKDVNDPHIVESLLQDPAKAKKLLKEQLDLSDIQEFDVENINYSMSGNKTVLMYAAYHGRLKWARYALAAGANVNRWYIQGGTALHWVLISQNDDTNKKSLVELFLKHKATVDRDDDKTKRTPLVLMLEQYNQYKDILDHISEGKDWHKLVNMRDKYIRNRPLIS